MGGSGNLVHPAFTAATLSTLGTKDEGKNHVKKSR